MKKIFVIFALAVFLNGCTIVSEKALSTKVKGFDYNQLGSVYTSMHTELYITETTDENYLTVRYSIDRYGYSSFGKNKFPFYILKKDIPNLIPLFDKYLEWESVAQTRHELVNKKIGNTKVPKLSIQYDYTFSSGSETHHYLQVDLCSYSLVDICTNTIYFDRNNVILLKEELLDIYNNKKQAFNESYYK
ncbi:hypothetical protein [Gilliamella apicola]|uniref:hypothetical protein n=1 Tax=Gilliamella apicola TaxID=1196095 RepID=UPI002FEDFDF3